MPQIDRGAWRRAAAALTLVVTAGCHHPAVPAGAGADDGTGAVQLEILSVPGDVRCIRVNAVGTRTVTSLTNVVAGQSTSALINLAGLPLGTVTFTADAFAVACTSVTAATVPTWVSESATLFVSAGELSSLTLVMHRPGATQVSVDFPDGGRELLPAGAQLVSAGTRASSTNYKVVFTAGQPSQAQERFDSPNYRLRGGLSPINGSTP